MNEKQINKWLRKRFSPVGWTLVGYYVLMNILVSVAMLRDVIASATKMMDYDLSIINIVKEEAAAYFAGQKTAQEVCKLIQSKANIYINEQK